MKPTKFPGLEVQVPWQYSLAEKKFPGLEVQVPGRVDEPGQVPVRQTLWEGEYEDAA
jgi:hypothetical protein